MQQAEYSPGQSPSEQQLPDGAKLHSKASELEGTIVEPAGTDRGTGQAVDPFQNYQCLGDNLQGAADGLYARPFRFHVYRNMPPELLEEVMERSKDWWKPDDA